MGAKTGVLAYASESVADALRGRPVESDRGAAEALLRRLYPAELVDAEGVAPLTSNLWEAVYPPEGAMYAACLPGVEIVCDRRLMVECPSMLPPSFLEAARGRLVVLHAMHSVVDWLAFGVWKDGVLIRFLSLSPDGGIQENLGEPFEFEAPFWAGEHPVEFDSDWDEEPYPLPFHPLELGEEALRALFGFVIEGWPDPQDIDASEIPMHGFRVRGVNGAP
ncbi:hypothetical protein KDL01_20670 [Actinospica durhamensis]|uniref:Uncharacterized protein n=1 Tax=Actinospica durhamensis TaxID=1508375 RepID=A0A941ESL0_9ACTN|nr:hypothetical protein [Actinospica durhamensis]MBR7835702.1 hypothetical protein [Actinospica durhamensis]